MADFGQQSTNLAILTFPQLKFEDRAASLTFHDFNSAKPKESVREVHAFAKLIQNFVRWQTSDVTTISAHDFESRMCQPLSQIAVVGNQQQPFGAFVQPPDGEQSLAMRRNEINGANASLRITVGTEHSFGFIQDKVLVSRLLQAFTVEPNILRLRIDAGCRVCNNLIVDRHSTVTNVGFAVASRVHSGCCQKLLQPGSIQ